jgi:hypothetical protein
MPEQQPIAIQLSFFALGKRSYSMDATLTIRPGGMTLTVPLEEDDPYVIVGRTSGAVTTGKHEGHPDDVEVIASWAFLGDTYVGVWDEDGERTLFSFSIGGAPDVSNEERQ